MRRAFVQHRDNRRATTVQRYVRGWLQRTRFRRKTELGRKHAARTAAAQRRVAAVVVFQKYWRRRAAIRKARSLPSADVFCSC